MLLRSASTPLLNSLVHVSNPRESPIEIESVHQIQRCRSLMISTSSSSPYSPMYVHFSDESIRNMKRTASESDLRHLTKPASKFLSGGALMEDVEEGIRFGLIRTSSYDGNLGFNWTLDEEDTEVAGGGGGIFHGGGKGRSGGRSDDEAHDSNSNDGTDVHYRKMIEANPGNGIFLIKDFISLYLRTVLINFNQLCALYSITEKDGLDQSPSAEKDGHES